MGTLITICDHVLKHGISILLYLFLLWVCFQLIQILIDEDKSSLWRGRLYKAIYALSSQREHEKKYISNDINGRINLARKELYFGKEILPKSIRVEWVTESTEKTYDIDEGEFVVCLDPSGCQEKNIVKLASAVVKRTSLQGIRHIFYEEQLLKAIDINLIKGILRNIRNRVALDWFFSNEYVTFPQSSVHF